jgi:DNA (cytosine-5)-methyltransferase 3A
MNVLSLFDGMACGMVALNRAGIKVDNYFASEIDRYAIQIAKKNHPSIIELGDISDWKIWNLPTINLIIAGSPCQGFSNSGKGLNFEDPRSKLYFVFEDIIKTLHPTYWLLENVRMKKEWADTIDERLEVKRVMINSTLLSAQNRERFYWANFPISQPEDKHILLKDIIEDNPNPVIFHNIYGGFKETTPRIFTEKSPTIRTAAGGGHIPSINVIGNIYPSKGQNGNIYDVEGKSPALRSGQGVIGRGIGSCNSPKVFVGRVVGRRLNNGVRDDYNKDITPVQRYEPRTDNKTGALTTVQKDNMLSVDAINYMNRVTADGRTHWDFGHHSDIENDKSAAVVANFYKGVPYNVLKDAGVIRKLTPIECERLQTLPDNYTEGVSNTQRYKMIGNGWTVDVIAHILSNLSTEKP